MIKIFPIIFLSLLVSSCNQTLSSTKIQNVVNKIGIEKQISSSESENYKDLLKLATINDLVVLTDNDNPIVRYYSFKALCKKNYPETKEIFIKHIKDKEHIFYIHGPCISGYSKVNSLMLYELNPNSTSLHKFTKKEYFEKSDIIDIINKQSY